jgi:hypothetical protein
MSNTTTIQYDIESDVRRYNKANEAYEASRLGSKTERRMYATMERIIARRQLLGDLDAFLDALHGR